LKNVLFRLERNGIAKLVKIKGIKTIPIPISLIDGIGKARFGKKSTASSIAFTN